MNTSRTINSGLRHVATSGLLLGVVLLGAGCSSLTKNTQSPLAAGAAEAAARGNVEGLVKSDSPVPAQPPGTVMVEFYSEAAKPQRGVVTLKGDMYVQDVLKTANGFRHFSRAKIELIRRTPAGNAHKMEVSYDRKAGKVDPQTDFHVQPGDRLIVTEDTSSTMTDMLKGLGIPVGNPAMNHLISG